MTGLGGGRGSASGSKWASQSDGGGGLRVQAGPEPRRCGVGSLAVSLLCPPPPTACSSLPSRRSWSSRRRRRCPNGDEAFAEPRPGSDKDPVSRKRKADVTGPVRHAWRTTARRDATSDRPSRAFWHVVRFETVPCLPSFVGATCAGSQAWDACQMIAWDSVGERSSTVNAEQFRRRLASCRRPAWEHTWQVVSCRRPVLGSVFPHSPHPSSVHIRFSRGYQSPSSACTLASTLQNPHPSLSRWTRWPLLTLTNTAKRTVAVATPARLMTDGHLNWSGLAKTMVET